MKARPKFLLAAVIAVSVVSDSMLLPFYPQFFAGQFAVADPRQVGWYLAAVCWVVMLAFPLWAAVAKRIRVLRLLVYTQLLAGLLSIGCYAADSLAQFWLVSLAMLAFKASYLLIYPLIMRLEQGENRGGTIGLLSVIVHLGAIAGAAAGGLLLQLLPPRQVFLFMALGDLAQMLVCLGLRHVETEQPAVAAPARANQARPPTPQRRLVSKLGLAMFLFYFAAYVARPFFARYWESVSAWNGELVSGLVFAIPGLMALAALLLGRRGAYPARGGLLWANLLGAAGLLLQAYPQEILVLLGRCLFGFALFHATVQLDSLLFQRSTPEAYAQDFSKIYFFQSAGALAASAAAGSLVAGYGLQFPFIVGAAGFCATALCCLTFRPAPAGTADTLDENLQPAPALYPNSENSLS